MQQIYDVNPYINIDLATNHGFIKNNIINNEYYMLQKKYYVILELFLYDKLNLEQIEKKLSNSGYFSNRKADLIKKINIKNIKLNYFFVRNNLNIEVLSTDQIKLLKELKEINQLLKLIENTFLDVIKANFLYGKKIENTKLLYDGTSFNNLKNNDSLILGFIDDLTDIEVSDEEWENFSIKSQILKNEILNDIEQSAKIKLNCNIEFIEYDLELLDNAKIN